MDNNEENFFEDSVPKKAVDISSLIEKESELAKLELLRLTRTRMQKSQLLDDVQEKALSILFERLNPENPEDINNISTNTLIYIVKEFSKSQSELLAGILGATKQSKQVGLDEKPVSSNDKVIPIEREEISKKEYNASKNILNFLEKVKDLEKSEFPEMREENG